MILPNDYYNIVEKRDYLKYVLYGDTDSVFILIPKDVSNLTNEKKWELANNTAKEINKHISTYMTEYLLPRCNCSTEYNYTNFKTELVFDSVMFMDVKKNYAYKLLIKEGKILDPPKIKYTGLQVIKSDTPKLTVNLLKNVIDNIVLNSEIQNKNKLKEISLVVTQTKQIFDNDIINFKFDNIGVPIKWGKQELPANSMKLFNFIIGKEIFSPFSSGRLIYCKFKNLQLFNSLNIKDLKAICVPYNYDIDIVRQKMEEFQISVDKNQQWDRIFSQTCTRIIDLIKNQYMSNPI